MELFCTIEYDSTARANGMRRCSRTAVAECAHCGASVCSGCCVRCCGVTLCGYCHDFHKLHSCIETPIQSEFRPAPIAFRPNLHHEAF